MNMIPDPARERAPNPQGPMELMLALADQAGAMLQVAEGLLKARREVSLDGLEARIGRICASALDLSADQGLAARARLICLLADLDRVRSLLVPGGEACREQ